MFKNFTKKAKVEDYIKEKQPYNKNATRNILYGYLNGKTAKLYEEARYAGLDESDIDDTIKKFEKYLASKEKSKDIERD